MPREIGEIRARSAAAQRRAVWTDAAMIFVACLVLFWIGNARTGLWDRDEARYAQSSAMMLHDGDWIVPKYFEYEPQPQYDRYRPRFQKPILVYWLEAPAFAVLGRNEFAARFFSGLLAAGAVVWTYFLGLWMVSRRVGRLAGAILATSLLVAVECRLGTVDPPLLFFTTWAIAAAWRILRGRGGLGWAMGFWVALALSVLTKGPVGPVVVAMVLLAALGLWWRRRAVFGGFCWITGAAVFLAIVLPWFVLVQRATDGAYLRQALGHEVLERAAESLENHYYFPGFYFVVWTLGLFPWSVFLPAALIWQWTKRRRDRRLWLLAAWFFLPRLMLEFFRTQLFHYPLPTLPAGALLIAFALSRGFGWGRRLWGELEGKLTVVLLAAACLLGAAGLPLALGWFRMYDALPAAIVLGVCTAGFGVTGCRLIVLGRLHTGAIWQMVGVAAVSCLVLGGWFVPSLEPYRLGRTVAEEALRHAGPEDRLVLFGWKEDSTVFYLGRDTPTGRQIRDRVWIAKQRDVPRRGPDGTIKLGKDGKPEMEAWLEPGNPLSGPAMRQIIDARNRGIGQIVIVSPDLQNEFVTTIRPAELLTPAGIWGINFGTPHIQNNSPFQPLYIYRVPPPPPPATGEADAPPPG